MIILMTYNDEIVLETCVVPNLVRKAYLKKIKQNGNIVKQ